MAKLKGNKLTEEQLKNPTGFDQYKVSSKTNLIPSEAAY